MVESGFHLFWLMHRFKFFLSKFVCTCSNYKHLFCFVAVFTVKKLESSAGKKQVPQMLNATPFLYTYTDKHIWHVALTFCSGSSLYCLKMRSTLQGQRSQRMRSGMKKTHQKNKVTKMFQIIFKKQYLTMVKRWQSCTISTRLTLKMGLWLYVHSCKESKKIWKTFEKTNVLPQFPA